MMPSTRGIFSSSRALVALAAALALGFAVIAGYVLYEARQDAWQTAIKAEENTVELLERQIRGDIEAYDRSLLGVIDGLKIPGISTVSPEIRNRALFDRATGMPGIGGILVFDRLGNIRVDSNAFEPRPGNFRDRDYFAVHAGRADAGLYISQPYASRLADGALSIAVSRRLDGADGQFDGVVGGFLRLRYFADLFESLDLGPGSAISFLRADGTMIMRLPQVADTIGRDFSHADLFDHFPAAQRGSFVGRGRIDGVERLYTFAQIGQFPLVVVAAMSTETIYAAWWRKIIGLGSVLLALGIATVVLAATLGRVLRLLRLAEAEARHAATRARISAANYRLLADASSDIIFRLDLKGRLQYASPAAERMLGIREAGPPSTRFMDVVVEEDRQDLVDAFARVRDAQETVARVFRCRDVEGRLRWLDAALSPAADEATGTTVGVVGIVRDITERKLAEDELAQQAATDSLTGLPNRRRFDDVLEREWSLAGRNAAWLSALMIDADHFKAYNDHFGHQQGDECLKAIAERIAANIRPPRDFAARYGGEEFVVLLPDTERAGGLIVAERIRAAIAGLGLEHPGTVSGVVTVSVGVASCLAIDGGSAEALVQRADEALYAAKQAGRNRIAAA